jgi:hypothetical protein
LIIFGQLNLMYSNLTDRPRRKIVTSSDKLFSVRNSCPLV